MDLIKVLTDSLRAAVGVPAAAYALAAVGLNVHFGYTGLLNFGHVAFMMVGAYGTAVTVDQGGPLWLGLLVGMGAAAVLGLLLGIPTLRLRADYLAIVTIAAAEILRLVARSNAVEPLTRGVFGIQAFANSFYDINPIPVGRYGFGTFNFSHRQLWVILVGWAAVVVALLLLTALLRSPWGRVLRAIREDEDAARSLGKNVFAYKIQSLVLGGVIGSLAGALLAIDTQAVNPDTFISILTFFTYTVLILGGPGRILAPVVGAVIFWFLLQLSDGLLRGALAAGWLGNVIEGSDIAAIRFALVGLALVLLMALRPQGILGSREELLADER
ncbi:MAG TPA: branched-chain amino acid ABC transporter permease [Acidimicrobiia bacterium]|nr:branched-chain amino acid ABC transporter permease [Acidimicrobiia bacterium]